MKLVFVFKEQSSNDEKNFEEQESIKSTEKEPGKSGMRSPLFCLFKNSDAVGPKFVESINKLSGCKLR